MFMGTLVLPSNTFVSFLPLGEVEGVLNDFKPNVVVHAAAERRPDVVSKQPESAKALNITATASLAELCKEKGIFLLYISTDYVFDGKSPPYKPEAPTNPLNTYGESKRDGELETLKYSEHAVLRVPILYGEVEYLGESAVTTLFSAVKDSTKETSVSDYQRRYPTHVADVAYVCSQLAKRHVEAVPGSPAAGIWHWSASECYTKYAMACTMAELFGLPTSHLIPVREPEVGATTRPYDTQLDPTATVRAIGHTPSVPFREGIQQSLQPYR